MSIECDVLVVGAGPAGLATAIAILRKAKAAKRICDEVKIPSVLVLDKGRSPGSHVLSGAVIDPRGFEMLLSDEEIKRLPVESHVGKESFRFLFGKGSSMKIPWVPPMMRQMGYPIASLTKIAASLAETAKREGAEVYTGYAVTELIEEDGRIVGAKTGEKGVAKDGSRKENYLPGEEIRAKVTVLAEGASGILTERLIAEKGLEGTRPQSYAVGIKELIDVPATGGSAGEIMHTFGYPVGMGTYGGGFVYHLSDTQVMVGYALGLDARDPSLDIHALFRLFKAQGAVAKHIEGGKSVAYGAKVIPEGGFYALPKPYFPGCLIVGDGAGLVDGLRIKGVHLAIESALAAADAILSGDIESYPRRLAATKGYAEVKRVKNVHGGFSYCAPVGVAMAGLAWATFGRFPFWRVGGTHLDSERTRRLTGPVRREELPPIAPNSPDRLTDVFMSGTIHEEDQPCHLKIRNSAKCDECEMLYGSPCTRFCAAEVYRREEGDLKIDFSNCLHCKTCRIKCPMGNVEWTFPQGGDGPRYTRM